MAQKKGKGKGKGGGGGNKPPPKPQKADGGKEVAPSPQERVDAVRPMWESLSHQERVKLLTVDLPALREKAKQHAETARQQAAAEVDGEPLDLIAMHLEPTLEEMLEEGVARLKERGTWKLWAWAAPGGEQQDFPDAESFRTHVTEKHIREELRRLLPRDDPKAPERPAEEAFRRRMSELLARVQAYNARAAEEQANAAGSGGKKGDSGARDKDRESKGDGKDKDVKEGKEAKDGKTTGSSGDADEGVLPPPVYRRRRHHAADAASLARDNNIELVNVMLEALEREHEVLYSSLLGPVAAYVAEVLPVDARDAAKAELLYDELDKLSAEDSAHVVEWLTEKVDSLSTRLKAEPREDEEEVAEEEENMGDVDLWVLAPATSDSTASGAEDGSNGGAGGVDGLSVNGRWLLHLQDRLLGEDGHPRKAKPGEDPHSCGLVLEWVFGSIVSTAEKARDGAKRPLGSYLPHVADAHAVLLRALEDAFAWESRLGQARALLAEMLKSRLEAQELARQHNVQPWPKAASPASVAAADGFAAASVTDGEVLPDAVVVAMLKREGLLTKAKLHFLLFEHLQADRQLRSLKSQLKQGEPEFERLKRELEEVKSSHRGLDGTYRSQAEMERHRAALADAAIEEQLSVQTAFREQGALLQGIYERKQRAEYEQAKRETEIKQLQGWKGTVESLTEKFCELLAARTASAGAGGEDGVAEGQGESSVAGGDAMDSDRPEGDMPDEESGSAGGLTPQQYIQLTKLRTHFHKDVRKQLYMDADDKTFFDNLKGEVKAVEKRLEEARVAIQHLEMSLVNVGCDDPGATIGTTLLLPLLQERLEQRAREFAAERAQLAESEVIRMEAEQAAREAAERERKRAAKEVKKSKHKSEKEKEKAEREAKEAAEREKREALASARKDAEEAERKRRQEALEAMRREEEALMEARRKELLSDENGYWRQRMRMEEERAAAELAAAAALSDDIDEVVAAAALAEARAADTATSGRTRGTVPADGEDDTAYTADGRRKRRDQNASGGMGGTISNSGARGGSGREREQRDGQRSTARERPVPAAGKPPPLPQLPPAPAQAPAPAGQQQAQVATHPPAQQPAAQPSSAAPARSEQQGPRVVVVVPGPAAAQLRVTTPAPTAAAPAAVATTPAPMGAPVAAPALPGSPSPTGGAIYFGAVPVPVAGPIPVLASPNSTAPLPPNTPQLPSAPPAGDQQSPSTGGSGTEQQQQQVAPGAGTAQSAPMPPQPASPVQPFPSPPPQQAPAVAGPGMKPMQYIPLQHMQGARPGMPPPHMGMPAPGQPMMAMQPMPPGAMPGAPGPMVRAGMPGAPMPMGMMQPPPGQPGPMQGPGVRPGGPPMVAMAVAGPYPGGHGMVHGGAGPMYMYPGAPHGGMIPSGPMSPQGPPMHPAAMGMPGVPMPPPLAMPPPGMHHQHHQHHNQQQHQQQNMSRSPVAQPPPPQQQQQQQRVPQLQQGPPPAPAPAPAAASPTPDAAATSSTSGATNDADAGQGSGPGSAALNVGAKPFVPVSVVKEPPHADGPPHAGAPPPPQAIQPQPMPLQPMPQQAYPGPQHPLMVPGGPHPMSVPMQQPGLIPAPGFPTYGPGPQQGGRGMGPNGRQGGRAARQQQQQQQQQQQMQMQQMHMHMHRMQMVAAQQGGMPPQHMGMAPMGPHVMVMHPMQLMQPMMQGPPTGPHGAMHMHHPGMPPPGPMGPGPMGPPPPGMGPPEGMPYPMDPKLMPAQAPPPSPGGPLERLDASASDNSSGCDDHAASPGPTGPAAAAVITPPTNPTPMHPQALGAADTLSTSPAQAGALNSVGGSGGTEGRLPPPATGGSSPQEHTHMAAAALASTQPTPAAVVDNVRLTTEALTPSSPKAVPLANGVHAAAQPTGSSKGIPHSPSWSSIASQKEKEAKEAKEREPRAAQQAPSSGALQGPTPVSAPTPAGGAWKNKLPVPVPAQAVRHVGTPAVGNFLAAPSAKVAGAVLRVTEVGAVLFEAPGAPPRRLQLVRGLRNGLTEYNCFLNVIIQSLWHLRPFREALLSLALPPAGSPATSGSAAADFGVLRALSSIFRALATPPEVLRANSPQVGSAPGCAVSPAELREALDALDPSGAASVRIERGEMHDACEVLGQILDCLHRAEARASSTPGTASSRDITLPQRVKLTSVLKANGGAVRGGAGSSPAPSYAAAATLPPPVSTAHRLFGLDVQVPVVAGEADGSGGGAGGRPGSFTAGTPQAMEALQYTKFYHLVTAQGLRSALSDAMPPSGVYDGAWEELLAASEGSSSAAAAGSAGGAVRTTLLRRPAVFTLALVWESPQTPVDAIKATLAALGPEVELPLVFKLPPTQMTAAVWPPGPGSRYALRAVVCYVGHHYLAFVLSEELRLWLCFDDTALSIVGGWADVCKAMLRSRMQPSLLLYEDGSTSGVFGGATSSVAGGSPH